jgi:hypothetical protein
MSPLLWPLSYGPRVKLAPGERLELSTLRLTAACSAS